MSTFWQDLRFAVRTLFRNPGFAVVSILVLTLGIAATTSIFSVVQAVLLQALPYGAPERLVSIETVKDNAGTIETWPTSYLDFADWRDGTDVFASMALYSDPQSFNVLSDNEPQRISAELVSAGYFELLGVKPVVGRTIAAEEDQLGGAQHVAVLSYGLWQRLFSGDRSVVGGQTLVLGGASYEIIGVMGQDFRGLTDEAEAWLPVMLGPELLVGNFLERRAARLCNAVARLADGATLAEAREKLTAIAASQAEAYPDTNENLSARVRSLAEKWFGDLRFRLLTLLGGALLVLVIACANIANLFLVRANARQTEFSLRSALGAGRGRLFFQLLIESVVLAGFGAVLGLIVAGLTTSVLVKMSGVDFRSFVEIGIDFTVIGAIVGISLLSAVGFGLAPAWMASRASLVQSLREGGKGTISKKRRRFRDALVAGEVALALFLLIGAVLMLRGFQSYRGKDLGYTTDILSMRLDLKGTRYAEAEPMVGLARQLLDRVNGLPEVSSAVLSGPGMPTDSWFIISFYLEDRMSETDEGRVVLPFHHVTPGYFSTLGIPLLRGRDFGPQDTPDTELGVIVSRAMEKTYWPDGDAIGQRIRFSRRAWLRVIGVVADVEQKALRRDIEWPGPDVYLGLLQYPPVLVPTLNVLLKPKAGIEVGALLPRLREEVRGLAPDLPLFDVASFEERLRDQTRQDRFLVILMTLFALLALALATVGLYGIISYTVAQRRAEIGIRMALGARPRDVLSLVLFRGSVLAAVGIGAGLVAAVALNRVFTSLLYGVDPNDALTLAGVSVGLFAVTLAAVWVPASRAMKVEPMSILRIE